MSGPGGKEEDSKEFEGDRDESDSEVNDIDIAEGYHSEEEEREREGEGDVEGGGWVEDGPPSTWFDDPQRGAAFEKAFTEVFYFFEYSVSSFVDSFSHSDFFQAEEYIHRNTIEKMSSDRNLWDSVMQAVSLGSFTLSLIFLFFFSLHLFFLYISLIHVQVLCGRCRISEKRKRQSPSLLSANEPRRWRK
jgi:hypothetical protein